MRVTKTSPCKLNTFLLLDFAVEAILKSKPFSEQSQHTCSCIYTLISYIQIKFTQKVVPNLHNPTTRCMYTLLWSHTPGTCTCKWLCACKIWWLLVTAGSRSSQRLFCTKSSVHGILVIKTRWEILIAVFTVQKF